MQKGLAWWHSSAQRQRTFTFSRGFRWKYLYWESSLEKHNEREFNWGIDVWIQLEERDGFDFS
jgi:hypothetical protein